MNKTFSLALRNVLRNRRRSITTVLAMIVGINSILLFGGFTRDVTFGLQTDFVRRSGHLQIQRTGYYLYGSGNATSYGIGDYERMIGAIKDDPVLAPKLVAVTPVLTLGGIAGNFAAGTSRTVLAQGILVDDQNRMRQWNDYNLPGPLERIVLSGTAPDAAVIGYGVARVLGLCNEFEIGECPPVPAPASNGAAASLPSDIAALSDLEAPPPGSAAASPRRIEILAASTKGAPNVAAATVVAAERQGVKELDDVHVALHLPLAQRLVYGGDKPQVTAVMLQLHHTDQLPEVRQRVGEILKTQFPQQDLDLLDFAVLNPFYGQTNNMFSTIFGFMFALIGVIVLFVVSNTMSMAIIERTVEIGTLRAMGMRQAGIQRLFVCEGLVLGIIGAAVGVLSAILIAYAVNHAGLWWLPPARVNPVGLTVRVWGQFGLIGASAVALVGVAALSAWLPARRAARIPVVDALRHV